MRLGKKWHSQNWPEEFDRSFESRHICIVVETVPRDGPRSSTWLFRLRYRTTISRCVGRRNDATETVAFHFCRCVQPTRLVWLHSPMSSIDGKQAAVAFFFFFAIKGEEYNKKKKGKKEKLSPPIPWPSESGVRGWGEGWSKTFASSTSIAECRG